MTYFGVLELPNEGKWAGVKVGGFLPCIPRSVCLVCAGAKLQSVLNMLKAQAEHSSGTGKKLQ